MSAEEAHTPAYHLYLEHQARLAELTAAGQEDPNQTRTLRGLLDLAWLGMTGAERALVSRSVPKEGD